MTLFDDLFADMGDAYAAIVKAHLGIKAEAGSPEAARLLGEGGTPGGPLPGDVVFADDTAWSWDSFDGEAYTWWSPALRETRPELDGQQVVWQGKLIEGNDMPEAAIELFNAAQWALSTHHLCMQEENERTHAKFFRRLGLEDVSDLVEAYRAAQALAGD